MIKRSVMSLLVAALLLAGAVPGAAKAVSDIPQTRGEFVTFLYSCVLNRLADGPGFESWVVHSKSGMVSVNDFYHGFFDSPEYVGLGVDDQTLVTQLYACVLYRQADGNQAGWLQSLQSGYSRSQVLDGFLYSEEFQTQILPRLQPLVAASIPAVPSSNQALVTHLYNCVLERQADAAGSGWVSQLDANTITLAQLYHGFYDSPEYQYKQLNDQAFVTSLYRCSLFRAPDGNIYGWYNALQSGYSRSQVLDGFLNSAEFQTHVKPKLQFTPVWQYQPAPRSYNRFYRNRYSF